MKSTFPISPDALWIHLKSLGFTPVGETELPRQWGIRSYSFNMFLFKIIPLGRHRISFLSIDDRSRVISTDEKGTIIKNWQHTMSVNDGTQPGMAIFQDKLHLSNGLMTIPTYVGVYFFFLYRHARIRSLISKGGL